MNTPAEAVVAIVGNHMGVVAIVDDVASFHLLLHTGGASAASLPPRMALVLSSSDVFAIAKTRHQQMYRDVYLLMRYLLLIFAKAPFSLIIFSGFFSLYVYGGLAAVG